jgi:hypothetical protein
MTTTEHRELECAVCEELSAHRMVRSTNTFGGYPDLDSRPPGMMRSTMFTWVQRCPSCGYCHRYLAEHLGDVKHIVESTEYRDLLGTAEQDGLAALFRCQCMLDEALGEYGSAAWASIHAAWAFDDVANAEAAHAARERALALIALAQEEDQCLADEPGIDTAIVVDLLRRVGRFKEALIEIQRLDRSEVDEWVIDLLEYQATLIEKKDTMCHTMQAVLKEE